MPEKNLPKENPDKKPLIILAGVGITSLFIMILVLVVGIIVWASTDDSDDDSDDTSTTISEKITLFDSNQEFDDYMGNLQDAQEEESGGMGSLWEDLGVADDLVMESAEAPLANMKDATGAGEETITNVQEAGVDEGDIVKAYKDFFIVLRRGRLFSVDTENFKTVSKVNAYPEEYDSNGWYDEMLISGDQVVVIGYNYSEGATEIGLFDISNDGILTHKDTYFIDSNDYYSSRNYASRLIDDELIIYMPYQIYFSNTREIDMPMIRKWVSGNELGEAEDLLAKTKIYKPVQDTQYPTLHTVLRCDLGSSDFDCEGSAIVGPYSRNFYVSANSIYVWVSDDAFWGGLTDEEEERLVERDAYVYKMDLDDNSFEALGVKGAPIDQFSFKESGKYLNVMVRSNGWGDAMWFPEFTEGEVALFRVPLSKFSTQPKATAKKYYTPLPDITGYDVQNRFVGDYLLYGSGNNWFGNEDEQDLFIKKVSDRSDAEKVDLGHSVDRIDVLGSDAVVIGTDKQDLKITSIDLKKAETLDTFTQKNALQGESRSHGFFYRNNNDGEGGILGLPIRKVGSEYSSLWDESIEVIFLSADEDKDFAYLGALESDDRNQADDDCEVSCVDWYGNSRPIFYGEKIFALIGYELIEGDIIDDKMEELQRLGFAN